MSNSNTGRRILIDAAYVDEVRVAVVDEGRVVEFDQELKDRKQFRGGNIYYAVVRRIEPSLQAVFIEYGMGKHGFLPFSEISVDNYQLPPEEKEALMKTVYGGAQEEIDEPHEDEDNVQQSDEDACNDEGNKLGEDRAVAHKGASNKSGKSKLSLHKMYKVQNVIKVDQRLMVQIVKEERGSKCATFSTYIVLAGRYCIFMPNSGNKNSGISRRIEDCDNRRNLKELLGEIKLPKESGIIIRTAGSNKSQEEIEQDLAYLQATWDEICAHCNTLEHPSLLYVEADIIRRTLRDFCSEGVHEIVVAGNKAYCQVKEYAKCMLGNKLRIRMYKGSVPIFVHYRINSQILELYTEKVHLPSGGYLVITPTEALVSVDVNSGRMTGEDSIEETAYRTNMEAVKEIARQVSLRGLSGLIIIDFIDMVKYRYCRAVEAEVREAFKGDRAKVQFGYISTFGLMEISRQRVKQSILETSTVQCLHCKGVGRIRSWESISASILRDVSYAANKNPEKIIVVTTAPQIVSYLFNNKRKYISDLEDEFKVIIRLEIGDSIQMSDFSIRAEKGYASAVNNGSTEPVHVVPKMAKEEKCKESEECAEESQKESSNQVQEESTRATGWVNKWLTRVLDNVS